MSLASFAHWLEGREWAMDFAASVHAYPIVLAIHLSCIAVFGGMILVTNLRLLGWALTDYPVTEVVSRLRAWKAAGFLIMAACGILLAGSEAGKYYANTYFWIKSHCWRWSRPTLSSFAAASIEAHRSRMAPR
jgi:hypothetical protein